MATNWKELADSAALRSEIYGLLSTVFREEPNEALIRELRGPRLSSIFSDVHVDLGTKFYNDPVSMVKEELAIEFARLFIGPGSHISAHESIFCEADSGQGGLWGKKTVEVKAFIEATGLDYDAGFNGIPDHVSVELEFMHKLTDWEAKKWREEDLDSAEYCLDVQRMFLEQHLLCWVPQFCDAVMSKAEIPFYRAMSELASDYMEFEQINDKEVCSG
jgi:TorA maturation chaperone TorD